jgi:predicted RNase H-like HicB family nuclease
MRHQFRAIIERDGDWFIAQSRKVPGANGQGRTAEECLENVDQAIDLILEGRRCLPT